MSAVESSARRHLTADYADHTDSKNKKNPRNPRNPRFSFLDNGRIELDGIWLRLLHSNAAYTLKYEAIGRTAYLGIFIRLIAGSLNR